MGWWDKLRNKSQRARGRAKEKAGRHAGDPYLETKGEAERLKGGAKQVGEQAKDAAKEVKKTL